MIIRGSLPFVIDCTITKLDTYLVYIPNLDVYRENGRVIALATMDNEESYAFPTTGLLDVELTVQLR